MGEAKAEQKAPKKSWFKGLSAEFKKLVWPSKENLAKQTAAVVASSIVLGAIITVIDIVVKYGVEFLVK